VAIGTTGPKLLIQEALVRIKDACSKASEPRSLCYKKQRFLRGERTAMDGWATNHQGWFVHLYLLHAHPLSATQKKRAPNRVALSSQRCLQRGLNNAWTASPGRFATKSSAF